LQVSTFQHQDEVFEGKLRLQSDGDVSSTSKNLTITPKPEILLQVEAFRSSFSLLLYFSALLRLASQGLSKNSFIFCKLQSFKGILILKARLAPFSY